MEIGIVGLLGVQLAMLLQGILEVLGERVRFLQLRTIQRVFSALQAHMLPHSILRSKR